MSIIGRTIRATKKMWAKKVIHRQFRGAWLDDIVIGPELNKRFEIRHPVKIRIGHKTAISGDLFINARGGSDYW